MPVANVRRQVEPLTFPAKQFQMQAVFFISNLNCFHRVERVKNTAYKEINKHTPTQHDLLLILLLEFTYLKRILATFDRIQNSHYPSTMIHLHYYTW